MDKKSKTLSTMAKQQPDIKGKVNHSLIVLVGPVGCGKSTFRKTLCCALEFNSIPFHFISGKNDLYLPFARLKGLVSDINSITREEMHNIMQELYRDYGKDLGTKLLIEYLKKAPQEVVYILDSKRNPEGIKALKKNKNIKVLIIGVSASVDVLTKRIKNRKRKSDNIKQEPSKILIREEKIFSISQTLQNSSVIVDNTYLQKIELEILCWDIINNFIYNKKLSFPKKPNLPKASSILENKNTLFSEDIEKLSKRIRFSFPKSQYQYIVIQGGNRYLASLLDTEHEQSISIKLTSLTKLPIYILFNSMLSAQERISILSPTEAENLLKIIKTLDLALVKSLRSFFMKSGFSIDEAVRYGNRAWLIEAICKLVKIPTPFHEPSSDKNRGNDFAKLNQHMEKKFPELLLLKFLLAPVFLGTSIYSRIKKLKHSILCIDDTLYRGRTLWTITVIFDIFGLKRNKWKFLALCSQPGSPALNLPQTIVLKPNTYYPFENTSITERGYWAVNPQYISWCSLDKYYAFLSDNTKKFSKNTIKQINATWAGLCARFYSDIQQKNLPTGVVQSLIELFCFSCTNKIKLNTKAILDQRAEGVPYCGAFVRYLQLSVNQMMPSTERQNYNRLVLEIINCLKLENKLKNNYLKECINFYSTNKNVIDLFYLSNNLNS